MWITTRNRLRLANQRFARFCPRLLGGPGCNLVVDFFEGMGESGEGPCPGFAFPHFPARFGEWVVFPSSLQSPTATVQRCPIDTGCHGCRDDFSDGCRWLPSVSCWLPDGCHGWRCDGCRTVADPLGNHAECPLLGGRTGHAAMAAMNDPSATWTFWIPDASRRVHRDEQVRSYICPRNLGAGNDLALRRCSVDNGCIDAL
jgi:hypothetical protein